MTRYAVAMRILPLLALTACFASGPRPCEPPGTQVTAPQAAGCLAIEDGRLLMVRDSAGWTIPAGRMKDGESSSDAAKRETREEAGGEVTVGPPVCAVLANHFVAHACFVPGAPQQPQADGVETSAARWVSREELEAMSPAELRFPEQRATWLGVMEGANRAMERLQRGEGPPE